MERSGLAVCFLMLTSTLWGVTAKHLFMKCEEDHECGENRFCYITGVCATCIDCSVYARNPHEWKSCAKSPTECGDCFDGYSADTLTEGGVRQFCIPLASVKNSGNKSDMSDAALPWYYAVFVALFALLLIVIVVLYCKYHTALAARHQLLKPEQPTTTELQYTRPPPYFVSGESPLLTRDPGGLHCRSDPAYQPDHLASNNTTYQDKEHDMKLFIIEKTTDGVQQALPFEYQPEDVKKCRPSSRNRSTCRPDEPLENYDKDDDDNEDGLSITHESGINGNDNWNPGPPGRTEKQDTEETPVSKRKCVASDTGSMSSHCECDYMHNLSCYSICSENFIDSIHEDSKEHLKCSSEKNILKVVPLPSKFDSGFISDSQVG